jgi:glucose/arabinose dehydrogenase/mono/diheme cytochrome c family protein
VEARIPWRALLATGGRPDVSESWRWLVLRHDGDAGGATARMSANAPLTNWEQPLVKEFGQLSFVPYDVLNPQQQQPWTASQRHSLDRMREFLAQVPSRVTGSPEPPPPYIVERRLPELRLSFPITMTADPLTGHLWFVDQAQSYGPGRLGRVSENQGAKEIQTLLQFEEGGVAYSIAFHPQYADNGYVYLGGNGKGAGDVKFTRVTRYIVDRNPPYHFDPDSAQVIIEWPSDGHNGGAIDFGSDGMLYITSGDGTSDSDTNVVGQGLDHLLSKVLRIDVDHVSPGQQYSVPSDNPFVNQANVRPETWAYGFRNPWRISIDRRKGHVWVGNNGQDLWEQIYLVQRGANYGWSVYEGGHLFYPNRKLGPTPVSQPIFDHPHSEARSMTGGVTYYGRKLPELHGAYIYGDYSTGKIWGAVVEGEQVVWHKELADSSLQITAIALDENGELLIADHRGNAEGGFYTLVPNTAEDDSARFPRRLSQTGLFQSVPDHRPHEGLIPYSVNAPLWSDGAHKERWIALPQHSPRIDFRKANGWEFPNGTVLVKSFALETQQDNPHSRRWIETRLLTRQDNEWVGYSYQWNADQTDAVLVDSEGRDQPFTIGMPDGTSRVQTWRYPSRSECMVCHSRAANFVLGLSTPQINGPHAYGGATANQLSVLEYLGVLRVDWLTELREALRGELRREGSFSDDEINNKIDRWTATAGQRSAVPSRLLHGTPDDYPRLADPYDSGQDLELRARSYLHANCAQCHVMAGGGNAQIDLDFATALQQTNMIDVVPLHHRFDLADPRLIAPGDPQRSVLLHRMSLRGSGQMPPLATSVVDQQALELLRQWIRQTTQPSHP